MDVCPECFSDKELRGFISSSKTIGDCGLCSSINVRLMNIDELIEFFRDLMANFQRSADGESLRTKINSNWNFFSSDTSAKQILNEVLKRISTDISDSEDLVEFTDDIVENHMHWEFIKKELKESRRFILDIEYLTEELGWDSFFNSQYELDSNDELFRARVHHQSGLAPMNSSDMMCPEPHLASGGRANPLGIPYLYLCDNTETVLYEVRASYLDELSIGTFHLKNGINSIKIVDFTESTSLFQLNEVNDAIKGSLLRKKISDDLSKPMRRYDSKLEYIPTQFICEFIKVFTGASGIRFRSSIHPVGKNVVIFDQGLMQCDKVKLKKVTRLELDASEIK